MIELRLPSTTPGGGRNGLSYCDQEPLQRIHSYHSQLRGGKIHEEGIPNVNLFLAFDAAVALAGLRKNTEQKQVRC